MPQQKTITVYGFTELEGRAKENAHATLAEWQTESAFWFNCIEEDFKHLASLLGVEVDRAYFTGFGSQGDGASFTGFYYYNQKAPQKIRQHAPKETELIALAERLQDVQRRYFYGLSARIKQAGHYVHSHAMAISVYPPETTWQDVSRKDEEEIRQILRELADWYFYRLHQDYEWLTSEEQCAVFAEANGYLFDARGEII